MTSLDIPVETSPRLARLLGFLERDPGNLSLLAAAASAAFDERHFDLSADLLGRHGAAGDLPAPLTNLQGLLAIAQQRFDDAADVFTRLRAAGHDDPGIRFNLAWAMAMTNRFEEACNLLDEDAIAASPRGPALKIQMMHHLEQYAEALVLGQALSERYPDNQALMGALATLAMDAEDSALAQHYAELAGDHPEGLAARAMFALDAQDATGALPLFERAIEQQPGNPRAWIGKGLSLLSTGQPQAGAAAIDQGAALFADHIGSWIAAGWAHFVNGEQDKARASFDRALAIDPNFAESHGGLAVLDILAGQMDSAKHHTDIALRLDRNCFGGALAKSLLLEGAGEVETARRVRELALSTPIGPKGQTIAQALAGFSARKNV